MNICLCFLNMKLGQNKSNQLDTSLKVIFFFSFWGIVGWDELVSNGLIETAWMQKDLSQTEITTNGAKSWLKSELEMEAKDHLR